MSLLPFDVCRCHGAVDANGLTHTACSTCKLLLWAKPDGPRSPYFLHPPINHETGRCEAFSPVPDGDN